MPENRGKGKNQTGMPPEYTFWLGRAAFFPCQILPTVSRAFCAKGAVEIVLAIPKGSLKILVYI